MAICLDQVVGAAEVEDWLRWSAFKSEKPGRVGVELEWLLFGPNMQRPRIQGVREMIQDVLLPFGSHVSFEPGGQIELSSMPFPSLPECVEACSTDAAVVRNVLGANGIRLVGRGLDTLRPAVRLVDSPWYDTLEMHYRQFGSAGMDMLCNSASVQICLDAGLDSGSGCESIDLRWDLVNALGPVLTAVFANSPGRAGSCSARQVSRFASDPVRARPVRKASSARSAWANHVLDSTLLVRSIDAAKIDYTPTLREWLRSSEGQGGMTRGEIELHTKTVMAPVRARGYLEIRMIDAQTEPDGWVLPLATVAALLEDDTAFGAAMDVLERPSFPRGSAWWLPAARFGLRLPALAEAAKAVAAIAVEGLERQGLGRLASMTQRFFETYTYRGRCPADSFASL